MTQFNQILSFTAKHTFYKNGVSGSWEYQPDSETQKIITSYGFKIKSHLNSIELYSSHSDSTQNVEDLLKSITEETGMTSFVFYLQSNDDYIFSVSDVPFDKLGTINIDSENIESRNDESIQLKTEWEIENNPKSFATIKIHFKDINTVDQSNVYEVTFNARSTQWQYFIINNSGLDLSNISIEGTGNLKLTGPEEVSLENNQKASLFHSGDHLLPFTEGAQDIFKLIRKKYDLGGNEIEPEIIINRLPIPNPHQIKINNIRGESIVSSPIYVYI